jgi:hypothetical protein
MFHLRFVRMENEMKWKRKIEIYIIDFGKKILKVDVTQQNKNNNIFNNTNKNK